MSNQKKVSMEGDSTLSIQFGELSEVAELKWDGASELIRGKVPESDNDAMRTIEDISYAQIITTLSNQRFSVRNIKSEIIHSAKWRAMRS